jgi:hypothetical protein
MYRNLHAARLFRRHERRYVSLSLRAREKKREKKKENPRNAHRFSIILIRVAVGFPLLSRHGEETSVPP